MAVIFRNVFEIQRIVLASATDSWSAFEADLVMDDRLFE
jgi:hypothetical protein